MKPIEIEMWGKDHWSTFAYCETRAVDYGGVLDLRHLRRDGDAHPTRLRGAVCMGHTDLDCIDDMEAAGLLVNKGTGINPVIKLTDLGWSVASALRQWKASGGTFATFRAERDGSITVKCKPGTLPELDWPFDSNLEADQDNPSTEKEPTP